ncbi:hypothetical protein Pmani_026574 [Petrolisthes manimaculis]|uniref:Uncharacterized protein n=1 Tax=Petrolisthes manimaculis TaxID=1843537 RepID=A0AAE1P5S4_9EUCA|nr:hypothetical protein Pmani_026574 [Petrolisthes manimaculis]
MQWSEVQWSEVQWSEVQCSEVQWSEVQWSEVQWSEVQWSEVQWSEVQWSEVEDLRELLFKKEVFSQEEGRSKKGGGTAPHKPSVLRPHGGLGRLWCCMSEWW